ncbi:DNA polymerase III subunit epsilon [bacterium endosymbiont of Pedicinus badii]|uniref:DNA polymerase III subunit epsilon n=1 Tax=bacterium endosymbiont of Pedicinus badii TaxID=1719126 RepID=UPI0009BB2C78|nr:DNA polymerase III subunit epsilon [bacterium endosymbiont of Pedicinus badii]OQM34277.1 DNA polymerase III subunit epsilon [bacterium endosymbiont of Pedicinus badii]
MKDRKIILDTETTGMNKFGVHYLGHRIIEIGAVEIVNRKITNNIFHTYINPNRKIEKEAFLIHKIDEKFLQNKPKFHEIAEKFINFIQNSELIIHNAKFDVGFINYELSFLKYKIKKIEEICKIVDTLKIARSLFPGKPNNLDALCSRYSIGKEKRKIHSAILDAKILANIFLKMTGGQTLMDFRKKYENKKIIYQKKNRKIRVLFPSIEEEKEHKKSMDIIQKNSGFCYWNR